MPKLSCSLNVYNLRPNDAPISTAGRERDVSTVRYLLETGQASIYDVDDRIGGLLEHAVQGKYGIYWSLNEVDSIQRILDHLLDQGCDPNSFYGPLTHRRLPAMILAFEGGHSAAISSLISRGGDVLSYGSVLAGCFHGMSGKFGWKIELARAMGYSDWHIESHLGRELSDTILHGASGHSDVSELLFALDIAGLDPNMKGSYGRTALDLAASRDFLKGAVILVEHGSGIELCRGSGYGTPLMRSLNQWNPYKMSGEWISRVTHYLLCRGADPQLKTDCGESAWHQIWRIAYYAVSTRPRSWPFVRLEGDLAHLLLYGADPFELFLNPGLISHHMTLALSHRLGSRLNLRATEIARSWSYGIKRDYRCLVPTDEWIAIFENKEGARMPAVNCGWSKSGRIYGKVPKDNFQHPDSTIVEDCATSTDNLGELQSSSIALNENDNEMNDSYDDHDDQDDHNYHDWHDENDNFFRAQTQFNTHISNAKGRRMLSRFPMVLALCSALQFAGYRAEMDEDGDIWYEDEDGDRYCDARATQPQGDEDEDFTPDLCPICQDFEGHGLGHILQTVEEAKREMREYREKVETSKKKWF